MKVLVTGISGKLGRIVARQLLAEDHTVCGIDRRPWIGAPDAIDIYQADVRKRAAAEAFRSAKPDAVIHMATVTHLTHRSADRFRINLQGTRSVVEHCAKANVKQLIFVGRHTYYGAAADSPLYHTEEEPPLALHSFPELADLVAADLYAGAALWRFPKIKTAVLRLVYTMGPSKHGTFATYLRGPRVPTVLGFDPLFQFMHEFDAGRAIVLSLKNKLNGVFNVSGPTPIPLSVVIEDTGRKAVPVPEKLLQFTFGRFGLPKLPKGAVDHLKYPIVVDSKAFASATGFKAGFDTTETLQSFASSHVIGSASDL